MGRLLRVLAITEFALENEINSFSATKQSMWSTPISDLNRTCRQGLSAVVNYALEKRIKHPWSDIHHQRGLFLQM